MLRQALLLTLLVALGVSKSSMHVNSKPDFSGTWNARVTEPSSMRLIISYQGPKLKISRTSRTGSDDFLYYVDGRGETNKALTYPLPMLFGTLKSTTAMSGHNFIISSSFTPQFPKNQANGYLTYTLEFSSDGRHLTRIPKCR